MSEIAPVALAHGLPKRSYADWEKLAAKVVNRGRENPLEPEQAAASLASLTSGGQDVAPLYLEGSTLDQGLPGSMPFTRGRLPRNPDQPWDIRGWHEESDPARAQEAIQDDLEHGVSSIMLQVGDGALPVEGISAALAGLHLNMAGVAIAAVTEQAAAATALLEHIAASGVDPNTVVASLGVDPIGVAAITGQEVEQSGLGPIVQAAGSYPQVTPITIDARIWHDGGASDADQIALAAATGVEYLRALAEQGIEIDDAMRAIEFRVAASDEQFTVIAALRALRRLWARIGEASGANENVRGARIHAVTSYRMMTATDPWVNLLRGTVACFAAAAGGADAITVLPFDAPLGRSERFSRRLARNTAHLLAFESHVAAVNDPAGGAYFVESLTDQLAADAWARLQEIEKLGGASAALAGGAIAEWLSAAREQRDEQLATISVPITGTSTFPPVSETLPERTARTQPEFTGLARRRDSEIFEQLRAQAAGLPPVRLAAVGSRKQVGSAQTAAVNLLAVAGIAAEVIEGEAATAELSKKTDADAKPGTVHLLDYDLPLPAKRTNVVHWLSSLIEKMGAAK